MAESSWPTAHGGSVTDTRYELLMNPMTADGVAGSPLQPSIVYADSTGRQVKIRPYRYVIVRGFTWTSGPVTTSLALAANTSTRARIDRVVVRLDRTSFNVRLAVLRGTPATKPVAPAYYQTSSPSRYYDVPIATVLVPAGAAGIAAGNVVNTCNYIAEPPLTSHTLGIPKSAPGRIWYNTTANRTYIGTASGKWTTLAYDSGWLNMSIASGWARADHFRARWKNGWVSINMAIKRTGGAINKSADVNLKTLTASYRPSGWVYGSCVVQNLYSSPAQHRGARSMLWGVNASGQIMLRGDDVFSIRTNNIVYGSLIYPVAG